VYLNALACLPDTRAEDSDRVFDSLLEGGKIRFLLERRPKRWAVESPGEHGQRLAVIDILKLCNEVSQFHLGVRKGDSVYQTPKEKFGAQTQVFLEFGARPDRHIPDAKPGRGCMHSVAALGRNAPAAYELERVWSPGRSTDGGRHVLLRLVLGQSASIDALDDGTLGWPIIKGALPDDVATLVASCLAEPREIGPAFAKMIGEDQALELGPAEILEVNWPNCSSYFHLKPCAPYLTE
jgi:hypothetical protein